jgi:hypothetical protein
MFAVKIYTARYVLFTVPIELLVAGYAVIRMVRLVSASRLAVVAAVVGMAGLAGLIYTAWLDTTGVAGLLENPATARWAADDAWQYIQEWPAGYGLPQAESYIRGVARHHAVIVYSKPRHQPVNALLFGLDDVPGVTIRPTTLPARLPPPRLAAVSLAVLDPPTDDLAAFRKLNPGWRIVGSWWKPGHFSEIVVLRRTGSSI